MGQAPAQLPGHFGKYSIVGHLATGGMAEVYLARAVGLQGFEKLVVLKRVRPDVSTAEITESFLDEARLVATLEHPNIAHVHEIGSVNGSYFFVMEYVAGGDLRQLMQRAAEAGRRVLLADAIYIIIQVCEALHYAHEKVDRDGRPLEIIHRDVSPSNVLLSHDGAVKVCDFGVAKATNRVRETKGGALKGKYAYMSPEQCKGRPLDRRSDVFSIGILLYELTTLQQLFVADSEFDVMCKIVESPIPAPSSAVADYPAELERIAMRALAKDRDHRYPTAQALQLDLEEFAREHKLALSSVSVTQLMATLFDRKLARTARMEMPAGTPPPPFALGSGGDDMYTVELNTSNPASGPAAPGRVLTVRGAARTAPAWLLILAGLAGVAAAGISIAASAMKTSADKEAAAVLDSDAVRIANAVDTAARTARMRAEGIATAPMVRAAIATDAATMKDLAATEYVFSVAHGETVELFQLAQAEQSAPRSILRLPESAPPVIVPVGHDAEFSISGSQLATVQVVPIAGYSSKVSGLVAIRAAVDLATPKQLLAGHAVSADLVGPNARIELVARRREAAGERRSIEVHRSGSAVISLVATPLAGAPPMWAAPARLGCIAIAALFILVYGLALLRARRA